MATCDPAPIFVDCDGNTIAVTIDALGNDVYQVCPDSTPGLTEWDSAVAASPPAPFTEGYYYDTLEECLTHFFLNGVLYEMCDDA